MPGLEAVGVSVAHVTHAPTRTGCTVCLFPAGAVCSGEVRGDAPASRETDLLAPGTLVSHVDAVVLTGGSAFGLGTADGVVRELAAAGIGFPTPGGVVPIVTALALYDLAEGEPGYPTAHDGAAATRDVLARGPQAVASGRVGAGTGATVGKWGGPAARRPGGVGQAVAAVDGIVVAVLLAVNCMGDILDETGRALTSPDGRPRTCGLPAGTFPVREATTIGVIATNARLDASGANFLARRASDAFGIAIRPPRTRYDGDALVAAAVGNRDAGLDQLTDLVTAAVPAAIRDAIRSTHVGE